MRTALASLIAAAGLAGAAHAQEAVTTPAPAAAPATPAAPPPSAATPPTAPAPEAAPAAPVAEPAPPPPTLPTTGDGAVIISVLEKVCVPAVRGQGFEATAKANGFKLNKREGTWILPLGGDRAYSVTLLPQGSNRDVCIAEIHYAIGQDAPIVSALNIWAFLHDPELVLQANYVAVDPDGVKRVRKSWEHFGANSSVAVNFSTERNANDTPLNSRYDTGKLFYQERKF